MPTRGALGVGSVSYRERGTVMDRGGQRGFVGNARPDSRVEEGRPGSTHGRVGGGPSRSLSAPSQRAILSSLQTGVRPSDEIICSSFPGIS